MKRTVTSLQAGWQFAKPGCPLQTVDLPHTWNAVDGQDGGNDYYRGTCTYVRALEVEPPTDGSRVWLEVTGAAMSADVTLNYRKLAHHAGGYSTFRVDLTDALQRGTPNLLSIAVDNASNDTVYPQQADFTFYGGLYREVNLITVPAAHFALGYYGAPGLQVTPRLADDLRSAEVELVAYTEGADGCTVNFTVEGVGMAHATVADGRASAVIPITDVHLWDGVDDPYLYTATAALDSGDEISARFGCRQFRVDPQQGFFLNGRSYPLRGVSRHQDRKGKGNALSPADHAEDIAIIKEIGANTVRLAHYQHAQEFYDLCDENGLIVWAEIPYITMHMPNGRENTLTQMRELIVQNYNHPSIVCWGLSNEITASPLPAGQEADRLENHRLLNALCHKLDPTRPTTMADVFMLETDDPILEIPDLNSYNLYFGWYLGELEQNDEFFDEYHAKYPDRCIGLSEYGADANPQYQSPHPAKGDYTESYQCLYHEHMLQMIAARPWLWATHVWNLFDFAADGRDEGGKHGENQKGLVTFDRKTRKDAFYAYKAYWSKEPFVHVCGGRYVDRAEDVTEVRVYSNQPEVTLSVDGRDLETQQGDKIFVFRVPLSGEHSITAHAGGCHSAIYVRKVAEPEPSYRFGQGGDVTNWFDQKDDTDPTCYSINDKMSDLQQNPQIAAMLGQMMASGAAARGDVADSVKDNPQLQRMMGRMTLKSLLGSMRDSVTPEQIQQLNAMLQTIKKP